MLFMIFLILCSVLMFLTVLLPEVAVFAVLALSIFDMDRAAWFGFEFSISIWAQIFFLAGCIIRQWITKDHVDWTIAYPLLFIAVAAGLSIPFSVNPIQSFRSAFQIISYLFLFYFICYFIKTSSHPKRFLSFHYFLLVVLILNSLGELLQLSKQETFHLQAGMQNWNILAVVLAGFVPFVLEKLQPLQLSKPFFLQSGWALILVCMIVGTQSRSGMILLIFSFIISGLHGLIDRKLIYFVAALFIVTLISALVFEFTGIYAVTNALQNIINSPRIQERAQNAVLALMTLAKNPFTGIGIGQWEEYSAWAFPNLSFAVLTEYSTFLVLLAETGLIGGLALVYLFLSILKIKQLNDESIELNRIHAKINASVLIWAAATLLYAAHLHVFTWCWLAYLCGINHNCKNEEN